MYSNYGTTSASYPATTVLKQLAIDKIPDFSKTSNVLVKDNVNDVLTDASTIELTQLLKMKGV